MKRKIRNSALIAAALLALLAISTPVHAQMVSTRTDRASYVPADSGTLIVTLANESPTDTVEIRNMTIYYPWAGFVDNKWQGNVSLNLSPYVTLGTSVGGANTYNHEFAFTVPSWYGGSFSRSCPGNSPRYGLYVACIMLGTNGNNLRYMDINLNAIPIAGAVYTPLSLVALAIPLTTLAVLTLATVFLALNWKATRRLHST